MRTIPKKIAIYAALIIVMGGVFAGGFYLGKSSVIQQICAPSTIDFSLFWDAYNKLKQNFIDPGKITDQNIVYGAINGMTQSLGDPYTDFFNPDQAKMFQQDLAGSFDGIGVEVGMKKGQLTIIAPLKGTPGEKAGLKAGDQILKVNGKNTSDMAEDEAVALIRGKKGTQVTLTIFREGWPQPKDIVITRDTIEVDPVDWKMLPGNVAYVHISQFDQNLPADFSKAARQVTASGATKMVLDLRDDPGGYLQACQEVAGWFLKSGQTVTIEDFGQGKDQQKYLADGNATFANYPVVVLINKGSASASEILAGALHDDRNIKLVGEKSFGKGSVQEVVNLRDGKSFLKITVAKWLTPKGNSISEVGLTPDVAVAMPDTVQPGQDPQLDKALEILKGLQ